MHYEKCKNLLNHFVLNVTFISEICEKLKGVFSCFNSLLWKVKIPVVNKMCSERPD